MRVVSLHRDVLVATSRVWQTTCTIVRNGDECFVVDSPVLPDELEILPALLEQAGFEFTGLLATHADWDHLLGRLAFAQAALGVAETTAARLAAEPGAAARELRAFDEEWYLPRPAPLSLGQVQALPVPGHCALGDEELELHPAEGHTPDGMAVWIGWANGPRLRRLPLAGRDPVDLRGRLARRLPRDAAAPGAARRASRARRARPWRGLGRHPRGGDPARRRRVPRGPARRRATAGPPLGGAAHDPRAQPCSHVISDATTRAVVAAWASSAVRFGFVAVAALAQK